MSDYMYENLCARMPSPILRSELLVRVNNGQGLKIMENVMGKVVKALVASVMLLGTSQPVKALDLESIFMLQVILNEHGFNAGAPDGKIGPATLNAIDTFAEKYGFPNDPDDLVTSIMMRNATHSNRITQEANFTVEEMHSITETVTRQLRDPDSAQIRNIRLVENPGGKFYCGEVNGKNSYGGYVGYTAFSTVVAEVNEKLFIQTVFIDNPDQVFSFWRCALAIPKI